MIPRFRPSLDRRDLLRIFLPAPADSLAQFKVEFSRLVQQRHVSTFAYGRMALYAFLKAMGIRGKEVICPAYTCVVVPHAIEASGNRCVFVDIAQGDLNQRFDLVRQAITPETGAIVLTSLYGSPVDLEATQTLRRDFPGIWIIQDCTHAVDGRTQGVPLSKTGDVAIFGLGISKPITTVLGGVLTTDRPDIHARVEAYVASVRKHREASRSLGKRVYLLLAYVAFLPPLYALTHWLERRGLLNAFLPFSEARRMGLPKDRFSDLSAFEAGVGLAQILKYSPTQYRHLRAARVYQESLGESSHFRFVPPPVASPFSHLNLLAEGREALLHALRRHGVQLGQMFDYAVPDLPLYARHRYVTLDRTAQSVARKIVNLPLCVSEGEARKISALIRLHYGLSPVEADPSRLGHSHSAASLESPPDPRRSRPPLEQYTPPGTA